MKEMIDRGWQTMLALAARGRDQSRQVTRWFVVSVLALDVIVAVLFLAGSFSSISAQQADQATEEAASAEAPTRWTARAIELLGQEMAQRLEQLEQREAELEELLRGSDVLTRAGLTPGSAAPAGQGAATANNAAPTPLPEDAAKRRQLFAQLKKTYENMEPETAAQALAKLAKRDKDAVVNLLLGWNPKVSGAVLDALTLNDPALAADLSYGIWLLSGKNQPGPASGGP